FKDYTESIPAFLTILVMVCASSISDGIMFGILFYMFFKIITRQFKDLNPAIILMAGLFVIKIVVSIIL
ncbi:MAG: NCS2 family permease, partial [Agathobacter sp.]|nr:NCS2 family permease [Agathobacter sp.]